MERRKNANRGEGKYNLPYSQNRRQERKILCERLKPVIRSIGSYQCGFMPSRGTSYQTLRQILEKTEEFSSEPVWNPKEAH
uniref:Uncharacterized protein n=1 Tax=Megaselia scalaris TaxID=36166 RepID=T1GL55_MEGSC